MKKASIILLVVFLSTVAFLVGFFAGRTVNRSQIQISKASVTSTAPSVSGETVPSDGRININTATALELSTLPGIGEVIAQRIVDYRQANGPFGSIADLAGVEGIGNKRLEDLIDLITVGG